MTFLCVDYPLSDTKKVGYILFSYTDVKCGTYWNFLQTLTDRTTTNLMKLNQTALLIRLLNIKHC